MLPIDELLKVLTKKLDDRFPGSMFQGGYRDHSLSSASWTMPGQKEDLLGAYAKLLASQGKPTLAAKLVPAIRFVTSDTGIASAKVSAMLEGTQHPIHIGSCIAVDHRHQSKVEDFEAALDQLFAQFGDSVAKLQKLLDIHLSYPVNAMTRICKSCLCRRKLLWKQSACLRWPMEEEPQPPMMCSWLCRRSPIFSNPTMHLRAKCSLWRRTWRGRLR